MKASLRSLSAVLVLLLLLTLCTVTLQAQVNAVYVESNDPTANTVIGYSNDGSGNLTLLPGSPYLTGGTGWVPPSGQPLAFQQDDDQQVVTNTAGTLLFAVNGHSNTIAAFTINSDASLSPAGPPISSAGSQPASIGLFDGVLSNGGSLMVVVNKSSDPNQLNQKAPNIATFTVTTSGVMTANVGSKIAYATGTSPSQAAIGQAKLVFVDEFMSAPASSITAYRIRSNGHMTQTSAVSVPIGDHVFLGEYVNPAANVLYASLPADGQIAIYSYVNGTGLLTFVGTVANSGSLACWLTMNSAGTRLYSAETASGTITVYDTTVATAPVQLQQITLNNAVGNNQPWNVKLDATGNFLYAVTGNGLHVINVLSDGTLSEVITPVLLPVNANTFPYGLATVLK